MQLDLMPAVFEQAPEGHARRAGGLASPTAQTGVEMLGQVGVDRAAALRDLFHEEDAAARRVRLELQ